MNLLDSFRLDGKIALLTGFSGNLGIVWTKALIEAGAKLIVIDLPEKHIEKKIQKKSYYQGDITDSIKLSSIHKDIAKKVGKIDILINNAGIDISPENFKKENKNREKLIARNNKIWDVNVQGAVNCIEEFYLDMEKKGGSIINIGSVYAERSSCQDLYSHLKSDKPWAYGASKAALLQVTRHFATRLAKHKIRVNTLSPGGVKGSQGKKFIDKYIDRVPLGKMVDKEKDLAGPLIFLASDASSYITGINLQVNGGYTAW